MIRQATQHDAHNLALLAERTFRDTFAAANNAEDMAMHAQASYGASIQAREIADPNRLSLVCEHDGALVAFAQLGLHSPSSNVVAEAPGELKRFYVDRAWHGKGLAQSLMAACLEAFATHGSDVIWLGVWEHNPRAITFYRKFGFVEVGAQVYVVGRDPQRDIIMSRPV